MKNIFIPTLAFFMLFSCPFVIYTGKTNQEQPDHKLKTNMAPFDKTKNSDTVSEPIELPDIFKGQLKIINPGSKLNSPVFDYAPTITSDGKTIYFISNREGSMEADKTINTYGYSPEFENSHDFWVTKKNEKLGTEFSQPNHLESEGVNGETLINTKFNEGSATISGDGKIMFFTACNRPGVLGNCDIFNIPMLGEKFGKDINLWTSINSEYWESQPSLTRNQNRIYFSSNRPGPNGDNNIDIWYSDWNEERKVFEKPKNLSVINSPGREWSPFISDDGLTLYFASDGLEPNFGGFDLYVTRFNPETKKWSKPLNLGKPVNSDKNDIFLTMPPSGDVIYFSSERTDIPGYQGGYDIFMALPAN